MDNDLKRIEQKTENVLKDILNWQPWEILTHLAAALIFAYVAYLFVVSPQQRTLTNWLLLLIALAVAVQIHQNINIQKRLDPRS